VVASAAHRELVQDWMQTEGATERQACRLIDFSRTLNKYKPSPRKDDLIIQRIKEIKRGRFRRKYGVPRVTATLRKEGFLVNHKRVRRICKELGLMTKKRRKPKPRNLEGLSHLPIATKPNEVWAMDFVSDRFVAGQTFRSFTMVDIHSRVCPGIYVGRTMKDGAFIELLENVKATQTLPKPFIMDNGPEFTSTQFTQWCKDNGISIYFIEKGRPTQNAYIESFNGKFRDECLSDTVWRDISHARRDIEIWRMDYNWNRPHSSLDYQTPMEYLTQKPACSI